MTHPHHSRALWLLAALLPSSCGDRNDDDDSSPSEDTDIEVAAPEVLTVDEFFELFGASYCEKNNVCLEAAGLEPIDCEMATADDDDSPPECEFNAEAAQECFDALETAQCDNLGFLPVPDICLEACPSPAPPDDTDEGDPEPTEFQSYSWSAQFGYDHSRGIAVTANGLEPAIILKIADTRHFLGSSSDYCRLWLFGTPQLSPASWGSQAGAMISFTIEIDEQLPEPECNYPGYDRRQLIDAISRIIQPGRVYGWSIEDDWPEDISDTFQSWGISPDVQVPAGMYTGGPPEFRPSSYDATYYAFAFEVDENFDEVHDRYGQSIPLTGDDRFDGDRIATGIWVVQNLYYWTLQ